MLAIQIKDVKTFMAKLLSADTFDSFLLEEAQIHTYNNFVIDGHQNRDFYTKEELEDPEVFPYEYSMWKDMKGICFQLIKGKKVPTLMKITLHKKPQEVRALLEKADALEYLLPWCATLSTSQLRSTFAFLTSLFSIVELISPVKRNLKLPYSSITTMEESLALLVPEPS